MSEYRGAATQVAAEWAKTLDTLAPASEVHVVDYTLSVLADPTSALGESVLDELCRQRCATPVPLRVVSTC